MAAAAREALPRAHRLRRRADFLLVQTCDKPVRSRHFVFLYRSTDGPTRLGIVASRKVGNAVARNRVKRLLREAFRRNRAALPANVDLVVVVRPPVGELGLAEVVAELVQAAPELVRRAGKRR